MKASAPKHAKIRRPHFRPHWSEPEAKAYIDAIHALDSESAFAERCASTVLARGASDFIGKDLTEEGLRLTSAALLAGQHALEIRLQVIREAQRRVLLCACYVLGVVP